MMTAPALQCLALCQVHPGSTSSFQKRPSERNASWWTWMALVLAFGPSSIYVLSGPLSWRLCSLSPGTEWDELPVLSLSRCLFPARPGVRPGSHTLGGWAAFGKVGGIFSLHFEAGNQENSLPRTGGQPGPSGQAGCWLCSGMVNWGPWRRPVLWLSPEG